MKSYTIETKFNSVEFVHNHGNLELHSPDKAVQSVINLKRPHSIELKNLECLMSVLLFIEEPRRILILGTAAGSLLHFLRHHYPQAHITAVDIDNELIDHLLETDILPPADDRLTYICADAQDIIQNNDQRFDLVLVDIFYGVRSPSWIFEKESIRQFYNLVSDKGALAFNLIIPNDDDFDRFNQSVRRQFKQQTLCLPVPGLSNWVLYGVRGSLRRDLSSVARKLSRQLGIDFTPILSMIIVKQEMR